MLLANQRLPVGNQILAALMSLLKSILRKRKFLSTSMFRWRFPKKFFNIFLCDDMELPYLYLTATNKEFTGKSSLTSFCAESSEKKLGWSTIFHELKSVVKAKIAKNDSQVSEGGINVKPGQDSNHELIITRDDVVSQRLKFGSAFLSFAWESKIAFFLTFPYPVPVPKNCVIFIGCNFKSRQVRFDCTSR